MATTYSCPECKGTEETPFIKDNGMPALISGSYVSESLLAYIIYQKYGLYLPLYRQEQVFLQMNAPIGRTSMAHWIITAGTEFEAIHYICNELNEMNYIDSDFVNKVIKREHISSTAFDNRIAIPHANDYDVNKSVIYVIINQKEMLWGSEKTNIIFLIALSSEDKKFFHELNDNISRLFSNPDDRIALLNVTDFNEFISIFRENT